MAAGTTLAAFALIAPAAFADPVSSPLIRPLAGVGSDTTQALMNALSEDPTTNKQIASYDAFGGSAVFNTRGLPGGRCDVTRSTVNGSGAGIGALQHALQNDPGSYVDPGNSNAPCLDFARSSSDSHTSFPSTKPAGQLSYVKYAKDALTVAIRSDSGLPNGDYTIGGTDPTLDLVQIYVNCVGGSDPNTAPIRPVLPQKGSGTRQFFLDKLGVARANQPTFEDTHACINMGYPLDPTNSFRVGPEEHHGNQLNDARDIFPYSSAVYLSQINRVINDDHGIAILGRVNAIRSAIPNPAAGAVGISIRANSGLPNAFTSNNQQDPLRLTEIYNCAFATTDVKPVLPAPGAVRTALLNRLYPGLTQTQIDTYEASHSCINVDFGPTRVGPAQNNGTVIAASNSVVPYSIEAYTAQINREVNDQHATLILGLIDGVPTQLLNTGASFVRDVFHVIPTNKETTAPWSTVFVGPSSLVCQASATITRLGFGQEPSGECGQIVSRTT